MSQLSRTFRFLQYLSSAKTQHSIQSPFVSELASEVIYDKRQYYAFEELATLQRLLKGNKNTIQVSDYGAGSKAMQGNTRRIGDIAKHAGSSSSEGKLLFRLVRYFKPANVLELGTSLGIGTSYLSKAHHLSHITTIEGCPQTATIAQQFFERQQLQNINLLVGRFEELLTTTLPQLSSLDLVIFDGNHQEQATINYFEQCLPFINNDTVFVFDDIYWSEGMEKAWQYIQNHSKVTATVDLFQLGLVFFRKEPKKEHFRLYFW